MKNKLLSRTILIAGLLLILLGSPFLLGSIAETLPMLLLGSFLLIIIGGFFVVFCIKFKFRPVFLFFAVFFILLGFYFFFQVSGIAVSPISQTWPLISVLAGVSIIPAGWFHSGRFRQVYVIPALSFMALGCVLLIFSYDLSPLSFKEFIVFWWPVIFLICGIILVLIALTGKKKDES
ncbi:hypothetical protein AGMMS50212_00650 [Spirochaetia bacterium]|nr:hypothetical protein AGMMS50212_00650 [Spirochaetia bacterium]